MESMEAKKARPVEPEKEAIEKAGSAEPEQKTAEPKKGAEEFVQKAIEASKKLCGATIHVEEGGDFSFELSASACSTESLRNIGEALKKRPHTLRYLAKRIRPSTREQKETVESWKS